MNDNRFLSPETIRVRAKYLTLLAVNILQPVSEEVLAESMNGQVSDVDLKEALGLLLTEERIAKDRDTYRTTAKGQRLTISKRGRILRDVQRMQFLIKLNREREHRGR